MHINHHFAKSYRRANDQVHPCQVDVIRTHLNYLRACTVASERIISTLVRHIEQASLLWPLGICHEQIPAQWDAREREGPVPLSVIAGISVCEPDMPVKSTCNLVRIDQPNHHAIHGLPSVVPQ